MPLHEIPPSESLRITSYGEGYFLVNGERHAGSIILTSSGALSRWSVNSVETFDAAMVEADMPAGLDVVLLGTGAAHSFPPAARLSRFYEIGVGVEVMSTAAACRTYNILAGEGREVMALLIAI